MTKKLTKADLEELLELQKIQLSMMEKMLLNNEDRNAKLQIDLLRIQTKKRPILDANLWLGLKIGFTLGSGLILILGLLLLTFI